VNVKMIKAWRRFQEGEEYEVDDQLGEKMVANEKALAGGGKVPEKITAASKVKAKK